MKQLLFIFLFFAQFSFSQSIIGKWKINLLFGKKEQNEFTLTTPDSKIESSTYLHLSIDGTFSSYYIPPCMNGCMSYYTGKYEITDNQYIRFYLEKEHRSGMTCDRNNLETEINKDLGFYRIERKNDSILLTKQSTP